MEGEVTSQKTNWEDLGDTQLKDALTRRGLNTDGTKEEIIQRLQDYDSVNEKSKEAAQADTEKTSSALSVEEEMLKTEEEDDEVIMMTDQEIQEIIDQPEVDMTEKEQEDEDCVMIVDSEEVDNKEEDTDKAAEAKDTDTVNGDTEVKASSEESEAKEEGKGTEKDGKNEAEAVDKDKKDDKEAPILMKNRMLFGYLCCNAVKSLIVTPFKKELMADEGFTSWLEQASSFCIQKTNNGKSAVLMKFSTLDKGDSACCALKSKLTTYEVEVYHPNKDIFSASRNSWTNLIKTVQNPQETLFNRLLILEKIPECENTDEKLCELFPGALDVVSFQFDPGCNGLAVVEFITAKEAVEFLETHDRQIEIGGEKLKLYKYDKRHLSYAGKQRDRSEVNKQNEIPKLGDDERKQMTEDYKAIKLELDNLQNSDAYFAAEKVARFVELDNKVNDMVRVLSNDTAHRFYTDKKEMPEGEENMLPCVRNTLAKMQNKINTVHKKRVSYNAGNEAGGAGGGKGDRFHHGQGGGRDQGNRRFSRDGSPPFRGKFSQGDNGGWRTMAQDRGSADGGRRYGDDRGGYRRNRSPGVGDGGYGRRDNFRQGRGGAYDRRGSSPGGFDRRNRSPNFRRERSPMYRRGDRDYGNGGGNRGWSPQDRRGRSPGGYGGNRRDLSPGNRGYGGGGRGWSPEYNRPRGGQEYNNPTYNRLEDKDFRNKGEGSGNTSKVLQEFTAVLADKVRSLEQLQQQTLQAQLIQGAIRGGPAAPNMAFPPNNQPNMFNSPGFNMGPGGR